MSKEAVNAYGTILKPKHLKHGFVAQFRKALSPEKIQEMLAILLRNKQAMEAVRDLITLESVPTLATWDQMAFIIAKDHLRDFGEMPSWGTMLAEGEQHVEDAGGYIQPEGHTAFEDLLAYTFNGDVHGADVGTSPEKAKLAIRRAKLLLEEATVQALRKELKDGKYNPVSLRAVAEAFTKRVDEIAALGLAVESSFPPGWDVEEPEVLETTGVPVLDHYMGGGIAKGEVVIYLAPMGSSKTTIACHGVTQKIKRGPWGELGSWDWDETAGVWRRPPRAEWPRRVHFLIFTEGRKRDYQNRLVASYARVPWKRVRTLGARGLAASHRSHDPELAYESFEFKDEWAKAEYEFSYTDHGAERDRAEEAAAYFDRHLVLVDATDAGGLAPGVAGIAAAVTNHFGRNPTHYAGSFWIDHISGLVDRMADADKDVDDKRQLVMKRLAREVQEKLVKPFGAPAILFAQLSGEANSKAQSGKAKLSHADAAGSKSLAEYADFAFVAGMPDEHRRTVLRCTKYRREKWRKPAVVEVNGMFQRVTHLTNFHVDGQGKIAHGGDSVQVIGTPTSPPPPAPGGHAEAVINAQPSANGVAPEGTLGSLLDGGAP